jgi:hypothetical protein
MLPTARTALRTTLISLVVVAASSLAAAHDMSMHAAAPCGMQPQPAMSAAGDEAPFLSENDAAMNRMMTDMQVAPTGDVDRDFVAMMEPHHQGAIDMAKALLRYGKNEQLRRLAQEIIVTQQQEIAAMRLAIGEKLPASVASPTQVSAGAAAPCEAISHNHAMP